jgi:L-ascorbate metabolism protein UlaG (beta-lactamase superfamily)
LDKILWGSHATVRIALGGEAVLTDPLLRARVMHLQRVVALIDGLDRGLSAVVISHLHHDYLDLASLRMISAGVPMVIPGGARAAPGRVARRRVIELVPGESVSVGALRIRATPAAHDGGRPELRSVAAPAMGYLIASAGQTVPFAGDTDLFAGMADLAPVIDCALLPVCGWGPTIGAGHLDPVRATQALYPAASTPRDPDSLGGPCVPVSADRACGTSCARRVRSLPRLRPALPVTLWCRCWPPGRAWPSPRGAHRAAIPPGPRSHGTLEVCRFPYRSWT